MSSSTDDTEIEAAIHTELNRLRGRLCGLIESWGLDERREQACKQTLKVLTYDSEKLLVELTSNSDMPRYINGG